MKKKIKLCGKDSHNWVEVGKCKDVIIGHPCKYYPEGCATCLTRFECYTKDNDAYCSRHSGVFYACTKCPAVKMEGTISYWTRRCTTNILDIRKSSWKGMDDNTIQRLRVKWGS